jgi:prepilin-type processing-associated H-X9-DG protein
MGLAVVSKGDPDQVLAKRFNDLRGHYAFKCAGNDWLAPRYIGPDAGVGPMVSYNTQRLQLMPASDWMGGVATHHYPPVDWRPSIQRIGSPSNKIFCGDGARYSSCVDPPDYDLTCDQGFGGAFSDGGAYSAYSRSWDRCRAPGNAGAPGGHDLTDVDARRYAFRHSTGSPPPGAAGNAYKGNFAFYDGHVDTMGDLDASSPFLWLPKGTVIEPASAEIWPDTMSHFGLGSTVEIGP